MTPALVRSPRSGDSEPRDGRRVEVLTPRTDLARGIEFEDARHRDRRDNGSVPTAQVIDTLRAGDVAPNHELTDIGGKALEAYALVELPQEADRLFQGARRGNGPLLPYGVVRKVLPVGLDD